MPVATQQASNELSPEVRAQIAQAVQPLVPRVQQQMVGSLRQHAEAESPPVAEQRSAPDVGGVLRRAIEWVVKMARAIYETVRTAIERLLEAIRHQITHLMLAIVGAIVKAVMRPLLIAALKGAVGSLSQPAKA